MLGIISVLQYLWIQRSPETEYNAILIRIDSQNAIYHVFQHGVPIMDTGMYLLPAISLARYLVQRFSKIGINVSPKYIPSKQNCAHCIAKNEQARRRRNDRWSVAYDVWPQFLPVVWQNVFRNVSSNQVAQECMSDDIDCDVYKSI